MNNTRKKEEWMTKTVVVWFLAMICCLLWGSAYPCIKIGYDLWGIGGSDTASQIVFAGVRFTLAGILAALFGSIAQRRFLKPEKQAIGNILCLASLQTVLQYFFFYIGLAHTSGVKASVIDAVNVFVAILVSSLLFRQERLNAGKIFGCLIGFAGVVLINLNGMNLQMHLNGEGAVFLSTIAYAFSSVFIKKFSARYNPVMLSAYQFMTGGVILAGVGLLMGGRLGAVSPQGLLLLLYMALISAVAYSLWGLLLKYNPVSKVAVFGFMNPVFGVLLSAWMLGEGEQAFRLTSVLSLVLVCVGIYVVNRGAFTERSPKGWHLPFDSGNKRGHNIGRENKKMPKFKRDNIFKGYYRAGKFDADKVAELVVMAIGSERNGSDFARACAVDKSTISRIVNKKISSPLAEVLIAKIAINSDPTCGLTMTEMAETLLAANGMERMPDATCDVKKVLLKTVDQEHSNSEALIPVEITACTSEDQELRTRRLEQYSKLMLVAREVSHTIQEVIQDRLRSMGKTVSVDADKTAVKGLEFDSDVDFVLRTDALLDEETHRWAFIRYRDTANKAALGLHHYFGLMFLHNPKEIKTRVTLVTTDKTTYQTILQMYGNAAIPASFSVMLVDEKKKIVEKEFVFDRNDGVIPVRLFEE